MEVLEGEMWTANLSDPNATVSKLTEDTTALDCLSKEHFLRLAPTVGFLAGLMVLGLPGNTLVFFVYWKRFGASSTRVFILAMAVCDLLTNAVSIPLAIVHMRMQYNWPSKELCKLMHAALRLPINTSIWLLVCVAVDRHRRICSPFKPQLTPRQAICILLIPVGLSSLLVSPFVVLGGLRRDVKDGLATMGCPVPLKAQGSSLQKHFGATTMVLFLGVVIVIAGCYGHIACKVRRLNMRRFLAVSSLRRYSWNTLRRLSKFRFSKTSAVSKERTQTEYLASRVSMSDAKPEDCSKPPSAGANCEGVNSRPEPGPVQTFAESDVTTASPGACPVSHTAQDTREELAVEDYPELDTIDTAGPCSQSTAADENVPGQKNGKDEERTHVRKRKMKRPKNLCSKTTIMMFVLTLTTLVDFLPVTIINILEDSCIGPTKSMTATNICMIARYFAYVNSVINPFIYSFCNPRFRLECRQYLRRACQRVRGNRVVRPDVKCQQTSLVSTSKQD